MGYNLEISKEADTIFNKLSKKNKNQLKIIDKKIQEILLNPNHFKPLKGNMKNIKRVHIDKSFVLTYEILEDKKIVRLLNYKHHDKIYLK